MSTWRQTRRKFLSGTAGAAGLILLGARTSFAQGPRIRKNVAELTAAEIASLERGVAAMKRLTRNFATSWAFQANMHGYVPAEERQVYRGWGSCQHGSWWFLPWHRGYLLYFERILRAASGDPNLTLPYWDWTNPDQRSLPARFLDPRSPLYERNRSFGANSGGELSESAIQWERALREIPFSTSQAQRGFGGQVVRTPGSYRPHGALESLAHDLVHDQIGGFMGSPNTAGRDPIFWLHHANVDRLWGQWLSQEGRYNPSDLPWLDTPFNFYGPRGVLGQATTRLILQTAAADYRYDTEPAGTAPLLAAMAPKKDQQPRKAAMAPQRPKTTVTLAAQAPAIQELGSRPVSATFKLAPESKRQMEGVLAAAPRAGDPMAEGPAIRVAVEDIRFDAPPGRIYEVYVNLPGPAEATGPPSPYFAGTISFFALHMDHAGGHAATAPARGATAIVDVTETVRRLREQGKLQDEVKVTLVPQTMKVRPRPGAAGMTPKAAMAPQAAPPQPRVTFGAIRLLREGE